jgi:hypothetical protein
MKQPVLKLRRGRPPCARTGSQVRLSAVTRKSEAPCEVSLMRVHALVLALLSHIRSGIIVGPKGAVIQPGMTLYYEKDAHAGLRCALGV